MIKNLVRKDIREFDPYKTNQIPYKIKLMQMKVHLTYQKKSEKKLWIFLKEWNLICIQMQESIELRKILASYWKVDYENIVVGTAQTS